MEADDDEVSRRAREVLAKREAIAKLVDDWAEEIEDAIPSLLSDALEAIAIRTAHRIASEDGRLFCYVAPVTAYRIVPLVAVQLPHDSDDWTHDDEILFDCTAYLALDAHGQAAEDEQKGLDRDAALQFCVEGALDGLAALVADGNEILPADLISAASSKLAVDAKTAPPPVSTTPPLRRPPSPPPPTFVERLITNGWFWLFLGIGAISVLGQLARIGR